MANSVVLFGIGCGGIALDQIQTFYINPNNYSPDQPFSDKYPDEKYQFSKFFDSYVYGKYASQKKKEKSN